MAFEAVLNQDQPKKWKRITVAVSLAVHAAALVGGVVYSFWRVDELPLPAVVVTLMSGMPPPPPPPPPPPAGGKKKTPQTKPKTKLEQPKTELVQQPKEQPKEAPPPPEEKEDEGEEGGVEGGEKGGVKGGVVGGVVGAPPPPPVKEQPKVLSAPIGHHQLAIDPNSDPYKVQVPPSLSRAGIQFSAIVTVHVNALGQVVNVIIRKGTDPAIDPQIPVVLRRWKYHPYQVNGQAVPFVYTFRYDVSAR